MLKNYFEYHFEFNNRLLDEIIKESHKLPEEVYPLFCHILNAHQIWNARILNQAPFGVWQEHAIEDCMTINLQNYQTTLQILDQFDIDHTISYTNSKGQVFTNTIGDILFHISNHSTHHRGQIIADFRRSGIDPIVTDYIFYRR